MHSFNIDIIQTRNNSANQLQRANSQWDINYAESGDDALSKMKAANYMFDVVLVDQCLHSVDALMGNELISIMRTNMNMHKCVIIGCTANVLKYKDVFLKVMTYKDGFLLVVLFFAIFILAILLLFHFLVLFMVAYLYVYDV